MKDLNFLITNDDGIFAEGLSSVINSLKDMANLYVVAPSGNRYCTAHSMSFHKRIYFERLNENMFAIDAFPVDCVFAGTKGFFKDKKFDLVISGMNHGANLGTDIFYSGTVSAAFRAAEDGIDSIAFSSCRALPPYSSDFTFKMIQKITRKFLENRETIRKRAIEYAKDKIYYIHEINPDHVSITLNVNFPDFEKFYDEEIVPTVLSSRLYLDEVVFENNSCSNSIDMVKDGYFEIVGKLANSQCKPITDLNVINKGKISISPFFYFLPGMIQLIPSAIESIF